MTQGHLRTTIGAATVAVLIALALTSPVVASSFSAATSYTPSESASLLVFGIALAASAQLARRREKSE